MIKLREILEKEEENLAPYAVKSGETQGRKFLEEPPVHRTHFMRDRDRIIHSTAFRRLEYKTQVFVNHEGDYYRTRLTHALEVQQIARTMARALSLNEQLTEAISLAHDIGHTPFGHAGEEKLNELMNNHGGFEHNRQGLRVVDVLEHKYTSFRGLNLCFETREGIIKHETDYDSPGFIQKEFNTDTSPSLEAQIVNVADEIAYNAHDLDDGLKSGYINTGDLNEVELWKKIYGETDENNSELERIYAAIRNFIKIEVNNVIEHSSKLIDDNSIKNIQDVYDSSHLVKFSPEMKGLNSELKQFLKNKLYNHYKVIKMQEKSKRFIENLFNIYLTDVQQLPPQFRNMEEEFGKHRVVCDYIAGMTDRFAQDEYERLFLPFSTM